MKTPNKASRLTARLRLLCFLTAVARRRRTLDVRESKCMGNDVSLVATDVAEEYPPRLPSHSWIGDCTEHVPLFWLCCFRLTDYKETRSDGWTRRYFCCSYDQATTQFNEGIETLRKEFPKSSFDCVEIEGFIQSFMGVLERHRRKFLMLEIWQCDDRPKFELMLQHCLAGFWHPACKFYYDPHNSGDWNINFLPPHESGIMDWGGALRRMYMKCQHKLGDLRQEFDGSSRDLLFHGFPDEELYLTGWCLL
jgi:hypothetical protein